MGFEATHAGLALATSIAAVLNAWFLYAGLRKQDVVRHSSGWPLLFLRIALASAAMIALLMVLQRPMGFWITAGLWQKSLWLAATIASGAALYFAVLWVSGVRFKQLRIRPEE
jgi:putative peptidoglycan lipid II flippase